MVGPLRRVQSSPASLGVQTPANTKDQKVQATTAGRARAASESFLSKPQSKARSTAAGASGAARTRPAVPPKPSLTRPAVPQKPTGLKPAMARKPVFIKESTETGVSSKTRPAVPAKPAILKKEELKTVVSKPGTGTQKTSSQKPPVPNKPIAYKKETFTTRVSVSTSTAVTRPGAQQAEPLRSRSPSPQPAPASPKPTPAKPQPVVSGFQADLQKAQSLLKEFAALNNSGVSMADKDGLIGDLWDHLENMSTSPAVKGDPAQRAQVNQMKEEFEELLSQATQEGARGGPSTSQAQASAGAVEEQAIGDMKEALLKDTGIGVLMQKLDKGIDTLSNQVSAKLPKPVLKETMAYCQKCSDELSGKLEDLRRQLEASQQRPDMSRAEAEALDDMFNLVESDVFVLQKELQGYSRDVE